MSSRPPDTVDSSAAWDAAKYDSCGTFVWEHGAGLVEILEPRSRERVLDVGCGTGHLTAKIAATGADVLGIDASESMVRQARTNYPRLRFEVLDALEMRLEPRFDAAFSNAVLHWITEPEMAASRIFDALKPGGRFVAELGGKGNIRAIIAAVHRAPPQDMGARDRTNAVVLPGRRRVLYAAGTSGLHGDVRAAVQSSHRLGRGPGRDDRLAADVRRAPARRLDRAAMRQRVWHRGGRPAKHDAPRRGLGGGLR